MFRESSKLPRMECIVPGCIKRRRAYYTMCPMHLSRLHRLGSLDLPERSPPLVRLPRQRPSFEERFHRQYTEGRGCWEWQGGRDRDGYGLIQWGPRQWRASRVAFTLAFGPIPDGAHVLHTCDNPPCVRPDHLWLGTNRANKNDSVEKHRHAVGERNGNAKLTEAQVREIRQQYATGEWTQRQLATEFGVSMALTSFIITRKAWRHI